MINLERVINSRYGFDRQEDKLPKRLLKEPAADGVGQGQVVDLDKVLDSYYASMGWDTASGLPTPEKLKELNLGWMV